MVTVRSLFSFEQFETVLQKLAHEIAIDAVTNLDQGRMRITTRSNKEFEHVETEVYTFSFYASRIGFLKMLYTKIKKDKSHDIEYFGFDVEEKEYQNSNHRTKISYTVQIEHELVGTRYIEKGNRKEKERIRGEEINAFIEKLMRDSNITPVARFNLQQMKT